MRGIDSFALNWIWIPVYGYYGSSWVTFICYGAMMVASYFLGQKYYPVPYDVTRFVTYIAIAVGMYFLSDRIEMLLPANLAFLNYGVSVLLLLSFVGLAYVFETGKLRVFKAMG